MHVAYVLKKFPRVSETFILNEILELERQGHTVSVFSLLPAVDGVFHRGLSQLRQPVRYVSPLKSAAVLRRLGEQLGPLREAREPIWQQIEDMALAGRTDLWSVLQWGLEIGALAREAGVEHLHAHFATVASHTARAAAAIAGLPFTFTCHAKDLYREGVDARAFQRLAGDALRVVTVCEANRRHVLDELGVGDTAEVVTLYNGVDLEAFHPRERAPDPGQLPLVLGVGRLVEKKGFRHLVEAVGVLRRDGVPLRCVIVGEGEEHRTLEALIQEHCPDAVELAGQRTHDDVRRLLASATVLALPCIVGSDGNRDALPTVLLEALAMGVPVVSTPVVGVAEIVDDGRAGVLVPEGDAMAMASALGELLQDADRRRSLAEAGRARAVACFDLRTNVATLARHFGAGVR